MVNNKRILAWLLICSGLTSVACSKKEDSDTTRDKLMPVTRSWWVGTETEAETLPPETETDAPAYRPGDDITFEVVVTPPEDTSPVIPIIPPDVTDPPYYPTQTQVHTDKPIETRPPATSAPDVLAGLPYVDMIDYVFSGITGKRTMLTGTGTMSGAGIPDLAMTIVRSSASSSGAMRLDLVGGDIAVHDYVYTQDGNKYYYSEQIMGSPTEISRDEVLSVYGMMPDVILPYDFTEKNMSSVTGRKDSGVYYVDIVYDKNKLPDDYKAYLKYVLGRGGVEFKDVNSVNIGFAFSSTGKLISFTVTEKYSAAKDGADFVCSTVVDYVIATS